MISNRFCTCSPSGTLGFRMASMIDWIDLTDARASNWIARGHKWGDSLDKPSRCIGSAERPWILAVTVQVSSEVSPLMSFAISVIVWERVDWCTCVQRISSTLQDAWKIMMICRRPSRIALTSHNLNRPSLMRGSARLSKKHHGLDKYVDSKCRLSVSTR